MNVLGRKKELEVLNKSQVSKKFSFIVLWGRRRVGKSRLLLEWNKRKKGIYWVADESSPAIQRRYFAEALSEKFPTMKDVEYRDWRTLFKVLTQEIRNKNWKGPLIIDELPYLVSVAKELPSVMQNWIDLDLKPLNFTLIVSGSSQSMMQGLALNGDSPLYGRATEIIKLSPLAPKYLKDALAIKSATEQIKAYTFWGGIPRYWELAEDYGKKIEESAYELLFKTGGILNQEPNRLLLEEKPSAISLRPILDAIGMGAHKPSEIAARLGQSSTSLSKGLFRLQELDLIEREIPFGESEKTGKKSLYKIKDPLFRIWFELISGRQGQIASLNKSDLIQFITSQLPHFSGKIWEDLCRKAFLNLPKIPKGAWLQPSRYWQGNGPEWDLISTTLDNKSIIIGECKWMTGKITKTDIQKTINALIKKGLPPLSKATFKDIYYFLFIPEIPSKKNELELDIGKKLGINLYVIDAQTVIQSIV